MRCEVHLSDVSTLVSSIKRNAEDVKTTKEVKCKTILSLLEKHINFEFLTFSDIITKTAVK